MSDILNVTVADGRYTVIQHEDGSTSVLRHGEPWAAYEGKPLGSLTLALAAEVDRLRKMAHGWNFDMSQAPRGRHRQDSQPGRGGSTRTVSRFIPDKVILATKCGKVTVSHFIPDEGRWAMLAAGEQPVAWMLWPEYPNEVCNV